MFAYVDRLFGPCGGGSSAGNLKGDYQAISSRRKVIDQEISSAVDCGPTHWYLTTVDSGRATYVGRWVAINKLGCTSETTRRFNQNHLQAGDVVSRFDLNRFITSIK